MALAGQDTNRARPRRPRVVYLDHCALESGGELALLRLLAALDQVEAHVILGADGPLVGMLAKEGISAEVLPMRDAARNLRKDTITTRSIPLVPAAEAGAYALRVARRLRQLKPDLVHTNSLKAAIYGGAASRLARVPVVWHVRDRIDVDYLPKEAVVLVRVLARYLPNALIANSQSTLDAIGVHRGLARIIYSPVIHDPVSTPDAVVRLPTPHLRIAMVGRISPWKGQHVFIEAFAQAFPEPGATAAIVGGPIFGELEYEASLHQLVRDLGLAGRVTFTGHVAQVGPILQRCDVAVHASTSPEPFGLVIVEAMAAGMAVIAAGAGGPAEIITDGVDGLLFEPGSAPALAAALRRLQDDAELRLRLGMAARRRAAAFAPDVIAKQVLEIYQAILARKGRTWLWGKPPA